MQLINDIVEVMAVISTSEKQRMLTVRHILIGSIFGQLRCDSVYVEAIKQLEAHRGVALTNTLKQNIYQKLLEAFVSA
jgi:hypothetical protein